MNAGERHQISAAGIAPFELAEEVSHSRIGIGQGECEAISLASRGERHGHGVALQFNRGWAVSKHDGHRKFPQQFKMLRACRNSVLALIAPSPGEGQVPVFRNCSRLADIPNNHPVDKVMSQGMSYGQAPNFLGIRRVGRPLPPACSPEPSEQATRAARLILHRPPSRAASLLVCSKDSSASLTTLVRKPSEDVAAEKKPTSIRKGHWRNQWSSKHQIALHDRRAPGVITGFAGPGEFLTESKFPSAEIAEQRALENLAYHRASVRKKGITYLGPVFFPADGEKP